MSEGHPAFLGQAPESSVETGARKDHPASALEVSEAALVPPEVRPVLADSVWGSSAGTVARKDVPVRAAWADVRAPVGEPPVLVGLVQGKSAATGG